MENNDFGVRLKMARRLRGMTQNDVARLARMNPATISHFETGMTLPSCETLKRIAEALCVSADYLLGLEQVDIDTTIKFSESASRTLWESLLKLTPTQRTIINDAVRHFTDVNDRGVAHAS